MSLDIFDILGRRITSLVNENKMAGKHAIEFNGSELSSGVYIYKIKAGNYVQTKKLILLK